MAKRVFTSLRPLFKVENAFAQLGKSDGSGPQTVLEVACVAYLCGRLRVEPT